MATSNPATEAARGKIMSNSSDIATRAPSSAQSAENAMTNLLKDPSRVRAVIDDTGKVTTAEGTEVPGNYSKLLDIFSELGSSVKQKAGVVMDTVTDAAKGLMKPADKVVSTGNAALGRGAPTAVAEGSSPLADIAATGSRLSPAAMALSVLMHSDPANAGEDEKLAQMNAASPDTSTPIPPADPTLDNQTSAAMPTQDPGINPGVKATKVSDMRPNPRPQTDIGQSMPQAATMTDNVTGKRGVDTAGGFYPQFDKSSGEAADFRTAFANARTSGVPSFMWQGREYNTEVKS